MDDPPGLLRPLSPHELFEVEPLEILHRVVEDAGRRAPVVEDGDGAGMAEARSQLHLALKPPDAVLAGFFRREQLDGGRTSKHRVAGAIDNAHPALANLLLEGVLAQALDFVRLGAQAEDDARANGADGERDRAPGDDIQHVA